MQNYGNEGGRAHRKKRAPSTETMLAVWRINREGFDSGRITSPFDHPRLPNSACRHHCNPSGFFSRCQTLLVCWSFFFWGKRGLYWSQTGGYFCSASLLELMTRDSAFQISEHFSSWFFSH
jgi:hypothetical protein